jgi:hypothetical protein
LWLGIKVSVEKNSDLSNLSGEAHFKLKVTTKLADTIST